MGIRHRVFACVGWAAAAMFAAVFALGTAAAPAIAQQYPPPAPSDNPDKPRPSKSPKPEKTAKPNVSADADDACRNARSDGDDGFMTGNVGSEVWTPCGPAVLGTTVADTGDGGVLPFTGGQILVWLFWAAMFLVFGTALVIASRYRERFAFLSPLGRGRGRRSDEGAEIARIDTSAFVPFLSNASPDDRSATPR